jgi:hypothetical protein
MESRKERERAGMMHKGERGNRKELTTRPKLTVRVMECGEM